MAKATKPLGGAAKDKYLKELIGSAGLDAAATQHLTETAKREITQVRVRLPLPERASSKSASTKTARQPSAPTTSLPQTSPAAPAPPPASTPPPPPAPNAAGPEATEPFDPFAFSATVVLKRKGKAELARLLEAVTESAHLKLIAEKQHLGLPPEATTAAELRAGIIAAAAARIDERRAAAS